MKYAKKRLEADERMKKIMERYNYKPTITN